MWGCLCSDMQKPPNMRASSNISFLCLVRPFSWHIWGLRNVLRTKIHTTYPWKIQLLGLWCSKVFFSFLHPNQCGLIQGFQLGLDRLWSNCATWLFKFLCCKLEKLIDFGCGFHFGEVLFVHSFGGIMQTWDLFYFIFIFIFFWNKMLIYFINFTDAVTALPFHPPHLATNRGKEPHVFINSFTASLPMTLLSGSLMKYKNEQSP